MTMRRGADLLVQSLVRAGTRHVFALSGNHVMSVFDAALDADLDIVHVRHEAATVHMADAWARVTGEVGVALVTGGPGHANAVSALYTALASDSPVLLLSGHAPMSELGRGAFQEMAQAEMARPVTKMSSTVRVADEIGTAIAHAMRVAKSGRPGPVHLSLPSDVLDGATSATLPDPAAFDAIRSAPDQTQVASMLATLRKAQRPVVITGPSMTALPTRPLNDSLQHALGIPVVAMESPRGLGDASLGAFAQVLGRADAALLIGKRRDFTLKFGAAFAADCAVLELSEDLSPVGVVRSLIEASSAHAKGPASWLQEVEHALRYRPATWADAARSTQRPMHALAVCAALQEALEAHPGAILVCDGGEFCQWVQGAVRAPLRIINGPAGAIGPGLPFAVAAKLARPDAPVIAAIGDGTFGFHMSELDTALRHRLPVVVVVGNDACWNAEHQIQLRAYGPARTHGCELLPTRYEDVAKALGGHGQFIEDPAALGAALRAMIASDRPACLNVAIARNAAPRL